MRKRIVSIFLSVVFALHCNIFGVSALGETGSSEDKAPVSDTSNAASLEERVANFRRIMADYKEKDRSYFIADVGGFTELCLDVQKILKKEPIISEVHGTALVVGDVHGNYGAVEYCCETFLAEIESGASIVFLGDYVDRGYFAPGGPNSIKILALLFQLKKMFPDRVFLLRGNHEDSSMNIQEAGFYGECGVDGIGIWIFANMVFTWLPLAAVIDDSVFCVHGGIGPSTDLDEIRRMSRPISDTYSDPRVSDLLWSDPNVAYNDSGLRIYIGSGFNPNIYRGGAGQLYGIDVVGTFLSENGFDFIVRGHQFVKSGLKDDFGNQSVFTLFSAPDYELKGGNKGAILKITDDVVDFVHIEYRP